MQMTRREIKFALQVEQLLNQIAEPEYREIIIEALTLLGCNLGKLMMAEPKIPTDRAFEVEPIVYRANRIFVEHNVCASGGRGGSESGLKVVLHTFSDEYGHHCAGVLRKRKAM